MVPLSNIYEWTPHATCNAVTGLSLSCINKKNWIPKWPFHMTEAWKRNPFRAELPWSIGRGRLRQDIRHKRGYYVWDDFSSNFGCVWIRLNFANLITSPLTSAWMLPDSIISFSVSFTKQFFTLHQTVLKADFLGQTLSGVRKYSLQLNQFNTTCRSEPCKLNIYLFIH